ncbi:hypothetical protein GCM10009767_13750 [Kocuria aegyptia]|uniref:Uncharacterized protein n=1 Tax=Kocuria aegyptia TaxID=330943 RepID=A0ABP4WP77_9MICC
MEVDPVVTGLIGFARRRCDAAATGIALKARDDEKGKPAEMSGGPGSGVTGSLTASTTYRKRLPC